MPTYTIWFKSLNIIFFFFYCISVIHPNACEPFVNVYKVLSAFVWPPSNNRVVARAFVWLSESLTMCYVSWSQLNFVWKPVYQLRKRRKQVEKQTRTFIHSIKLTKLPFQKPTIKKTLVVFFDSKRIMHIHVLMKALINPCSLL